MTLEEKEAKKVELRNAINEAETEEKLEELKGRLERQVQINSLLKRI